MYSLKLELKAKIRGVSSALDGFPGLKRLRSPEACRRHTRRASAKLTPVDRCLSRLSWNKQEANFKKFELCDLSDLYKFCIVQKKNAKHHKIFLHSCLS